MSSQVLEARIVGLDLLVEPDVERDLIVPAPARMQFAADRPDQLG